MKKKAKKEQRRPHKVILLRMPPEKYEVVAEHVRGMNKAQRMGDPRATLTGFIMRCIENAVMYDPRQLSIRGTR